MIIKKEIIINSDIKKVWKIFSQIEEWHEWGGYILNAKWLSKSKWKINSMFVQSIKGFLFVEYYNSECIILKINPYKFVEWTGTRKLIRGVHFFKFTKIGNKTKVSNIEYFKGPLAPIIFPFIRNKFKLYFEQFLNGLKKEAEK